MKKKQLSFLPYLIMLCVSVSSVSMSAQNLVLDFDGDGDQLLITSPVNGSNDFTTELWFNSRNDGGLINLISWGDVSTDFPSRFNIYILNNRLVVVDDAFGSSLIYPSRVNINPDGTWHHLAISKSGNEISIYHNGTEYTYTTGGAGAFNLLENLILGYRANQNLKAWNGQIDDLRIWNVARSKAQIDDVRDCTLVGNEPALLSYYNFETEVTNENGLSYIANGAAVDQRGLLDGFELSGATSNIVPLVGRSPSECISTQQDCTTFFESEREPCSNEYKFITNEKDTDLDYLWVITRDNPSDSDTLITSSIDYTFDFRDNGEGSANYMVCLTVTFDDECIAGHCERIGIPLSDQTYFEITDDVEDIIVEANSETCNAIVDAQFLNLITCSGSSISQGHIRSDGKAMDEPYEVGTTTVTILIGDFTPGLAGPNIIDNSSSYNVVVAGNDSCCDQIPDISESLIPNPDFEETNCIPDRISQIECANGWIQANQTATADLMNITNISWAEQSLGAIPDPPNGSQNFTGVHHNLTGFEYVEYVGSCLNGAILANTDYTFQAYFGTPEGNGDTWSATGFDGDIVFLGISNCSSFPLNGRECKEDEFEEIGRISVDIAANSWLPNKVSIPIRGSQDYEAIIFGPSCNPYPISEDGIRSYLLIDELLVVPGTIEDCPQENGCFSVESNSIVCNDDLSYDINIKIRNENDQIFDRLLMFSQSNGTAVNPTISLEFGENQGTLLPGETSGDISFTIRQLEFVDQPVEVCFDVIPQNPEGGDCCKDEFCITLPACCPAEETTNISLEEIDDPEQCCYQLSVNNECAENHYKGLNVSMLTEDLEISLNDLSASFNTVLNDTGFSIIANGNGEGQAFFPTGTNVLANICIVGLSPDSPETQEINFSWVVCDEDDQDLILPPTIETINCPIPPEECALISNMQVECLNDGTKQLTFDIQNESFEQVNAQQLVVAADGNITYSPQSFDNIDLDPGDSQSFTIDITDSGNSNSFDFILSLHDYNTQLDDGNYWCCFNHELISIALPVCDQGAVDPVDIKSGNLDFIVYPNPANELITIALKELSDKPIGFSLINLNGEVLDQNDIAPMTDHFKHSIQTMPPSIYWIKLKYADGRISYKKVLKF